MEGPVGRGTQSIGALPDHGRERRRAHAPVPDERQALHELRPWAYRRRQVLPGVRGETGLMVRPSGKRSTPVSALKPDLRPVNQAAGIESSA